MRRLISIGLCALAALALAVASASASAPTWTECAKAAKSGKLFTGHYTGKTCTEGTAVEAGGKYELREGVGKGKPFKGKGGKAVLHVKTWLGDSTVECTSSTDSGTPKVPNLETGVAIHYKGCKGLARKTCTSGEHAGEIEIEDLKGELGYITEGPTPAVGLKLESEANPGAEGELASFSCEDLDVTLTGGMIGVRSKDVNVVSKESETVDLAGENIGQREHEGIKYKPLVNIVGWAGEQAAIAAEIKADEHGEISKLVRPILKAQICGAPCAAVAYAGQDRTTLDKGEALMVNTKFKTGDAGKTVLVGEKLEHSKNGDAKKEEITPLKFAALKSGSVEEIFFESGGQTPQESQQTPESSLVLAIQEDAGGGRPGKILAEGTYKGRLGKNQLASVGGFKVPVVKGKTYWLTFLPLGGAVTYWYENNETVIFSENHKSLVESPPETWTWEEEPDFEGKPSGAPIGIWAKGT
jgi:hypothetical protein